MTLGGLCPIDQKLEAICNWKVPQNVKDVCSFVGFAISYRRYIHQFAEVAHLLTKLTKKGVEWQWGPVILRCSYTHAFLCRPTVAVCFHYVISQERPHQDQRDGTR